MKTILWLITIQNFFIVCVNGYGFKYDWSRWGAWVVNASCSTTCGPGARIKTRKRTCEHTYVQYRIKGKNGCHEGSNTDKVTIVCNIRPCAVNGGWGPWAKAEEEGMCSITCGLGVGSIAMTHYRSCTNPTPKYGGVPCEGKFKKYTKVDCAANKPCSVAGAGWGEWNIHSTGPCSATCGTGTKQIVRKRLCDNPPPQRGAEDCFGNPVQFITNSCNSTFKCTVHGGWSVWTTTNATRCTVTCGSGFQNIYQRRLCNNPTPNNGGRKCVGNSRESKMIVCKANSACVVDGGWSKWKADGIAECSVTCGYGTRQALWLRICNNPTPTYDGQPCIGNSSATSVEDCTAKMSCNDLVNDTLVTTVSPQASSESNAGLISGSVVGVFLAICLVAVGVLLFRKSKKPKPDASVKTGKTEIKTKNRHVTPHKNPAFTPDKPDESK